MQHGTAATAAFQKASVDQVHAAAALGDCQSDRMADAAALLRPGFATTFVFTTHFRLSTAIFCVTGFRSSWGVAILCGILVALEITDNIDSPIAFEIAAEIDPFATPNLFRFSFTSATTAPALRILRGITT